MVIPQPTCRCEPICIVFMFFLCPFSPFLFFLCSFLGVCVLLLNVDPPARLQLCRPFLNLGDSSPLILFILPFSLFFSFFLPFSFSFFVLPFYFSFCLKLHSYIFKREDGCLFVLSFLPLFSFLVPVFLILHMKPPDAKGSTKKYGTIWEFSQFRGGGGLLNPKTLLKKIPF